MIVSNDFEVTTSSMRYKKNIYQLKKINRVRVKTNKFKDHILRAVFFGLLISSILWVIAPPTMGLLTAPLVLVGGIVSALASIKRYELQIEFKHTDGTGLQWISVAKTNRHSVKEIFDEKSDEVFRMLNPQ
ncbi:DUF6232 family protein [Photobacterium lutimaris]|uniref:Uncharacterized protein n=1 Tax=Photobacterium lutimaris TaxID=388278 RepID=A0A2T3J2V3_9GAMM|nr:DUF6232 family protein [Photobacterium lutimaris]PSU35615.1 hypothetical protein C9I99_00920 [Photobacterium lutimaris]TDR78667.1 hypothetical protein DFP78_101180 [Photobacterium lutimaris]